MNKYCFSFSLYGLDIFYYLPLIANIKIITENNDKYNFGYDIVIYTEEQCKQLLLQILSQENISTKYIKFKFLGKNIGSNGMMWRYYEATLDNYDIVYIHDIDTLIYKRIFFELEDFKKTDKSLMIFHTNNKSYQLCDGGNFGFKPKLFKNKEYFKKIIEEWIKFDDITYFTDEVLLNKLFQKQFISNDLIVYSYMQNSIFVEREKHDFKNIKYLDETTDEFKQFKCFQLSSKQSKEILKYYDAKNIMYQLNDAIIDCRKKSANILKINYKKDYITKLNFI